VASRFALALCCWTFSDILVLQFLILFTTCLVYIPGLFAILLPLRNKHFCSMDSGACMPSRCVLLLFAAVYSTLFMMNGERRFAV
jgi:hypothetical protein